MLRSTVVSPEANMSTVDRLSMPKERSKGMELIGYTLLERLKEMRDIMRVKEARMERLKLVTREEHDLQEKVITLLRKEIKVKEAIVIKAGNYEQQMVSHVLKDDRRPRLQMRNSDVQGAMYALEEWFSFQKNLLNLVRRSQAKREQFYDRKQREIEYLDHISSTVDEENVRRLVRRYENNIAKLKVKYRTAQHLQTSYHNILDRYHQESLLLGHRLETLEKTLRMHHSELMDLMEMKAEIEVTLDHTLRHLPRTQEAVQKASAERKDIEAATRKTERDLRVEKLLSRQRRKSERMGIENGNDVVDIGLEREEDTAQMLNHQLNFDTIKSLTSAADTTAILEAFVKQSVVNDEVTELKRQKERERKRLVEELERLKADRQRRMFEEQNVVSRGKKLEEEMLQRILTEEKGLEQKLALLKSRGDVLFQIDKGVTSIYEKLLANQEEGVISVDDALFHGQRDATGSITSDRLYCCQRVMTSLLNQLESADREEVLTDCLLFGEMVDDHLDLLIPAGAKLMPRKDAEGLSEFEYDQKEVSGVLTREEMKKQHRRFYELRKRRAAHDRASGI